MQTMINMWRFFVHFHQGVVNILLHAIGFFVCFYALWQQDILLFALGVVMLESGHIYNHFAGLQKYDFRFQDIALAHSFVSTFNLYCCFSFSILCKHLHILMRLLHQSGNTSHFLSLLG